MYIIYTVRLNLVYSKTADMSATTKKITMIEDVPSIRENVSKFIGLHDEFEVIQTFDSVESFVQHTDVDAGFSPDILLLDIGLTGMSGVDGIPLILNKRPYIDIIMLTTYEEEEVILKALCSGACSYITKKASLKQIVEAIRIVTNGGSYMSPSIAREIVNHLLGGSKKTATNSLSERQNQILKGLSEGKSYKLISEELFISVETVRTHIKKLYRHLQVNNKAAAISMYLRGEIK